MVTHNACCICGKDIPGSRLFCDACKDNIMRKNESVRRGGLLRKIFGRFIKSR